MSLPSEMNCNDLHAFISTKFPVAADILRNHFMDGSLLSDSTTHELILIGIPLGIAKTILGVIRGELDITLLPSEQSLREALQNAISADAQQQQQQMIPTSGTSSQVSMLTSPHTPLSHHHSSNSQHMADISVVDQDHLSMKNGRTPPPPLPSPSPSTPGQIHTPSHPHHQELVWSDLSLAAQTALRAALKHAQIYSQKSCESNPYYSSINEAAKQLILEGKVTIADSKGHILELAKKAVNKTYSFKKGKSRSRCSQNVESGGLTPRDLMSEDVMYVEKDSLGKHSAFCLTDEGGSQDLLMDPSNSSGKQYGSKRRRTSEDSHEMDHSPEGQNHLLTNVLSLTSNSSPSPNMSKSSTFPTVPTHEDLMAAVEAGVNMADGQFSLE